MSYLNLEQHSPLLNQNTADFNARSHIALQIDDQLTGDGITIAVLDTGIYPNHSAFTDNETINWNERILAFYDENEDKVIEDPYDISWHGTWTASILGGNTSKYTGVAPSVKFVILKIFNEKDGELTSDISIIKNAIDWIIQNKKNYDIKIASMSFGAQYEDNSAETKELNDIVEELSAENILVVASSGNYGSATTEGDVSAPGSAKSVLTVGGVDYDGDMYEKSGRGPTFEDVLKPDVCAPAVNILGAEPGPSNDEYSSHSGTSASTPFVSGLAALLLEKEEDLDAMEIKSIISMTAYRTYEPTTIRDNTQGWGIVQGYAAIDALSKPIEAKSPLSIKFELNEDKPIYCQPITLKGVNHYFFELTSLDHGEAEIFLFSNEPDDYGNPILVSNSLNILNNLGSSKKIGVYVNEDQKYFLIIKGIHEKATGKYKITLIIEYNLGIIFIFVSLNSLSLIILVRQFKNLKNVNYNIKIIF
ncbi:MAG: S8 family serine peptidase [Promethearchaeota archaeon]